MSDDLVRNLREARYVAFDECGDYDLAQEAATALTEARAEIEALQGMLSDMEALKNTYRDDCLAAESELSTLRAELDASNANHRQMATTMADLAREHDTLRARVRDVVGPFAEMRQALELISANKPGDELLDERAIFQTWGLKNTPTSKQITLGHLRAARQLNEDLK